MAGTGQPQEFSQTDFGEGLWGGLSSTGPNPPQTSFSIPYIAATPPDSIPFTSEVPSLQSITIAFDFTRLLGTGETISTSTFTVSSGLTVSNTFTSGAITSAFISSTLINGESATVLCSFVGSAGTRNARRATLIAYDAGESILL